MLVTVSQYRDEYLNSGLPSQIIGDVDGDGEGKSQRISFINAVDSRRFFNENKSEIPQGYEVLSEKYYKNELIPPPLVSKAWLLLLTNKSAGSDDCVSEDDSLPLQELRNKLIKNVLENETPNLVNTDDLLTNLPANKKNKQARSTKEKLHKYLLVNRKRGRPRKSKKSLVQTPLENLILDVTDTSPQYDEFQSDMVDICDIPIEKEVQSYNEDNLIVINFREHDYFKQVDSKPKENPTIEDKKRKKKKTPSIGGVKVEESKTSYPCLECGKSFSAASTLKNHLRIHNGTLLICTECHKGFTTKYLLKCHMRIHSGDLFMCHKCGKGFTTAELLKVHSRGHTGDRPFMCNVCGKSFPSASNLSQHRQTHNSEKKFLCFQCGSSFSQKRCLDGHMLTHAEKNHICTVCGKLWARKSDLSEHMRVHTGVKPYCCSICPQKFTQASSLKRHHIVHMEVKPIQCSTCRKMFKCQEYYKRHVKKHEKEADYLFNNIKKK